MPKSATRGTPVTLQNAATTGNGTVIAVPDSFKNHRFNIKGSAGIGAGAVQLESADSDTYSGTWSPIGGGPVTLSASTEFEFSFQAIYRFVRARISTNVTGGTVTIEYTGS